MKAKAVITTKYNGAYYRPFTVDQIESYFVDTAIDSDSDPWQIVIGDLDHNLIDTLSQNNEVRVQLYGVGYGAQLLMTGIADDISYTETGTLTIDGRDMSSLAVDSTLPPKQWQKVSAAMLIPEQAKEIGMPGPFYITTKGVIKKIQYTDASESYWDFWYRLVRKDQMYIWTAPNGALFTGLLNYNDPNPYSFGAPPKNANFAEASKYIPVETLEFRKTTQGRFGEVWVYGHKGDNGFLYIAKDPDTQDWIKKPRKIMLDTDAHTSTGAEKMAKEEIYESQVGAVEIRITIPDQGWIVRQNKMAHLNVPEIGIEGDYFVVGTRVQADTQGFIQEVRLRAKGFAVTRRVPTSPKLPDSPSDKVTDELGNILGVRWADYFILAANKWHGPWDFKLYLATLLAICNKETGFGNWRQNGGPGGDHVEWYQWNDVQRDHPGVGDGLKRDSNGRTLEEWHEVFANEAGDSYVNTEYGVGPMQLTSRNFKEAADDLMETGHRDEFTGGRWHPQHNIMEGAHVLREKLQATVRDSGREIDMWVGVAAYNGSGTAAAAYAQSVKNMVYNNPGYLKQVEDAIQAAKDAADRAKDPVTPTPTPPSDPDFGPLGKGFLYSRQVIGFPGQGTHSWTAEPNNWQSDNAVDIACAFGSEVYAVHSGHVGNFGVLPGTGVVVVQGPNESGDRFAGNRINVIGPNQSTYFAHLSRINPLVAQYGLFVKAGTLLGWTGIANGVKHLHFACERGNPFQFIPGGDPR